LLLLLFFACRTELPFGGADVLETEILADVLGRSMHMPTFDYFHMFQVIKHICQLSPQICPGAAGIS
jgi:hypothetical protein